MTKHTTPVLSIVVPLYNEEAALPVFHAALLKVLKSEAVAMPFEIIYCDDGSRDGTLKALQQIATADSSVRVVRLTRNFGKEIATTAGLRQATGAAIITIDADSQHPVELIPEFIARWRKGSKVVIGVRKRNQGEGLVKRYGSKLFYRSLARFTNLAVTPGSTDYRLIDAEVQQLFNQMTEHNRISRSLIDWLGFERDYISFTANARIHGQASYSFIKLAKLAVDSVISMSISPLYVTAIVGAILVPLATLLGLFMLCNVLLGDPAGLHATGGAYVLVLLLFLSALMLMAQGVIGLYLSHIHSETQNRPLYVIDEHGSKGVQV